METVPHRQCIVVTFSDNAVKKELRPKPCRGTLTSAALDIAFAEAEVHPYVDLDISLD